MKMVTSLASLIMSATMSSCVASTYVDPPLISPTTNQLTATERREICNSVFESHGKLISVSWRGDLESEKWYIGVIVQDEADRAAASAISWEVVWRTKRALGDWVHEPDWWRSFTYGGEGVPPEGIELCSFTGHGSLTYYVAVGTMEASGWMRNERNAHSAARKIALDKHTDQERYGDYTGVMINNGWKTPEMSNIRWEVPWECDKVRVPTKEQSNEEANESSR